MTIETDHWRRNGDCMGLEHEVDDTVPERI